MLRSATFTAMAALTLIASSASAQDRVTYSAYTRGTSVTIPETKVAELCGDIDGCTVRIGMYNWDGKGRTASRSSLFFYNKYTKNWRAERDDAEGTTDNGSTEHIVKAWSCYFTDGYYKNWTNHGDFNRNFAVLSWNQYNARACRVTLID